MVSKKVKETFKNIKTLKIQGARNVAQSAVESLKGIKSTTELKASVTYLKKSRPTEPMMRNALNYVLYKVDEGYSVNEAIDGFLLMSKENIEKIATYGSRRVKSGSEIMTFCHSSSVTAVLKQAWKQGKRFEVLVAETRPLFQGRITAKELSKIGIPVTFMVDSAVRSYINDMDLVLMGADAITSDGHVVNKIGSSTVALCAHEARTDCGVVSEIFKFDPMTTKGGLEPIEKRDPKEVWKNPPRRVKVLNPAFDMTPPEYVDFVVTEAGVLNVYGIVDMVRDKYPWMFSYK